jgi:O-antigen ligase
MSRVRRSGPSEEIRLLTTANGTPNLLERSTDAPLVAHEVQPVGRGRSIDRLLQRLGGYAERGFLLFLMLQMTGASLVGPGPSDARAAYTESSLTDSIFALLYLILGALIVLRIKGVAQAALAHKWTLLLLATVAASALWSQDQQITVLRTIKILVTCFVGWYLVARFRPREIFTLLAIVLAFTGLVSVYWGMVNTGLSGLEWRGAYEHKNVLARAMVLSAVTCLLLLMEAVRMRWLLWAGFALSCALVVLSQSATGIIVLTVLVFVIRFSASLRLRATILVPLLIACTLLVAGGALWLQANAAGAARLVGKDVTLTGRTELWAVAISMIERHPWLGYGFGGFWRGPVGDSGEFWRAVRWQAPHAHNGYIDLTLDLGVIGVVIFLLALGTALIAATARARTARTVSALAPLVVLSFLAVYNLTESSVLRHNTLYLAFFAVATSMAFGARERPTVTRRRQRGDLRRDPYRVRRTG